MGETQVAPERRVEKEGMKRRTIFHSLLLTFLLLYCLVIINNHNFTDNFFSLFA